MTTSVLLSLFLTIAPVHAGPRTDDVPTVTEPTPVPAATTIPEYLEPTKFPGLWTLDRIANPDKVCPTEHVSTDIRHFYELGAKQAMPAGAEAEDFTMAVCMTPAFFTDLVCDMTPEQARQPWAATPLRMSDARLLKMPMVVQRDHPHTQSPSEILDGLMSAMADPARNGMMHEGWVIHSSVCGG